MSERYEIQARLLQRRDGLVVRNESRLARADTLAEAIRAARDWSAAEYAGAHFACALRETGRAMEVRFGDWRVTYVGGGLRADQQVRVAGAWPAPLPFTEPLGEDLVGERVEHDLAGLDARAEREVSAGEIELVEPQHPRGRRSERVDGDQRDDHARHGRVRALEQRCCNGSGAASGSPRPGSCWPIGRPRSSGASTPPTPNWPPTSG
jgi:hypothetical protein